MALDRWIALVLLCGFCAYAYAAFFMMDQLLPPILQRNPIWPSTFPKVLAIGGIAISLLVLIGIEKSPNPDAMEINYRRLTEYKAGQAAILIALMVAYALLLRPLGFLASTFLFLAIGSVLLGERRYLLVAFVAALAAGGIWYLVEEVLGIFLRPLPIFL